MIDLAPVFEELRAILVPYSEHLTVKKDTESELYLDTDHLQKSKSPLFFAAVQIKKSYVSFHLMPVYLQPALLERVSPELKKQMHGKSCFNFRSVEQGLFAELAVLTEAGFESYKEQGFIRTPPESSPEVTSGPTPGL